MLHWAHELRRLGAPLISAYMYGIASLSLQLARRFDDARKTILAAYEIWEPMNLRHEHFNCHAQLTMVELYQGREARDELDAAHEALRPVDAPGKHVALRMLELPSLPCSTCTSSPSSSRPGTTRVRSVAR